MNESLTLLHFKLCNLNCCWCIQRVLCFHTACDGLSRLSECSNIHLLAVQPLCQHQSVQHRQIYATILPWIVKLVFQRNVFLDFILLSTIAVVCKDLQWTAGNRYIVDEVMVHCEDSQHHNILRSERYHICQHVSGILLETHKTVCMYYYSWPAGLRLRNTVKEIIIMESFLTTHSRVKNLN